MARKTERPPQSPAAIAIQTGMELPGLPLAQVAQSDATAQGESPVVTGMAVEPGASGAEGLARLPQTDRDAARSL